MGGGMTPHFIGYIHSSTPALLKTSSHPVIKPEKENVPSLSHETLGKSLSNIPPAVHSALTHTFPFCYHTKN
jgi:hypothetical protein